MVKLKRQKLLYSSKEMCCKIDSQLKKLMHLKFLILQTPFFLYSIVISVLHTLNTLSPMFSGIVSNKFSFFGLKAIEKILQHFCVNY